MKTIHSINTQLFYLAASMLASTIPISAAVTITFNAPSLFSGTNYTELGVLFRVIIPPGEPYYDGIVRIPAITGPSNVPYNNTPYMIFLQQNSPSDYVVFSRADSLAFGLSSISLADPRSPSPSAVPITFKGYKTDGSTVSDTFTTPGGGANSFLNYQFSSDFSSGLTSVEINSTRWAMDNLVVVPEPGTTSLLVVGLMVCGGVSAYKRRQNRTAPAKHVSPQSSQ